ncbi:MAG: tRNA pseudouridine(38-40) synthase TruA [Bacteroidia bacterium]
MQRYFLQLAYKGTNYHGWQVQANALSVQQVVDEALSSILRHPAPTLGCGRTDTGVHALDFFAHFDSASEKTLKDPDFIYHLNCMLPWDIAAKKIHSVRSDAHARFDAISRTYEYRIVYQKDPFLIDRAMLCRNNLDVEAMQQAARILFGYSDFGCFSKNLTQVKTNICKLMLAEWTEVSGGLIFRIQADRFLRNMVRAIVGTLLDIGRGKITEADLRRIIEGKNRSDAGTSVPAGGLYLCEIEYPSDIYTA